MDEIIAQATELDAKWIISGIAEAFAIFAGWVGKFAKQIWSVSKIMHKDHTTVLESAITKQSDSTSELKDLTIEVLTETREIKKIQEESKYSISELNKRLANL